MKLLTGIISGLVITRIVLFGYLNTMQPRITTLDISIEKPKGFQ
ncbi:MAG: hypothetical protein U9N85_12210 [Bacteroidota bacterium]|nr:hypothetical protein [Bacteroidota bacterium]